MFAFKLIKIIFVTVLKKHDIYNLIYNAIAMMSNLFRQYSQYVEHLKDSYDFYISFNYYNTNNFDTFK